MIKELMRRIGRLVAIACLPVMALVAPAGRAEAEIVVTFPQAPISPFENAAPVAQAFYFTEGGLVFLTGRNSFDDDEDRLFYEWTQIDGPQVTLASADEVEANFPKPILTQGDEPITYTFSLTVSDGVAEDEEEVIVTIFPPRVIREPQAVAKVVGKTPEDGVYTVTGGETVTLTAEDSIGFGKQEPAYLWQTESPGIALSAEEGVTTSFVAPVVTAPTEVTVQLTLGVILDISRASPSLVSPIEDDAFTTLVRVKVVPAGNKDAEAKAAKQRVQKFVQSRMSLLLANQPDFVLDVLGGSASNGSANLNVSSMGGQADFATAPGQPVWLRLKGSWSTVDGAEGDYILGSVGAQVVAGDGYALGVMAQVDHMKTVDGLAVAEGTGVMAGPYAVVRLKTMPVTV